METAATTASRSVPWNKGKLLGQKPPLKLKEIWGIRGQCAVPSAPCSVLAALGPTVSVRPGADIAFRRLDLSLLLPTFSFLRERPLAHCKSAQGAGCP